MKMYLSLTIYRPDHGSFVGQVDTTNGGISSNREATLWIEHEEGFMSEDHINQMIASGEPHYFVEVRDRAISGQCIVQVGQQVRPMAGGNFAWSCDSRISRIMPTPLPIHDRFE